MFVVAKGDRIVWPAAIRNFQQLSAIVIDTDRLGGRASFVAPLVLEQATRRVVGPN
jgi:hypothetical protein